MTIKDYMDKNLPNLNWNILPQLFEDGGIELTDEIEVYLKNTPENTNWNILKKLQKVEEEVKKIILQIDNNKIIYSDFDNPQELYEYCEEHAVILSNESFAADKLKIYIEPYEVEPITLYKSEYTPSWILTFTPSPGITYYWGVNNNPYEYFYNVIE